MLVSFYSLTRELVLRRKNKILHPCLPNIGTYIPEADSLDEKQDGSRKDAGWKWLRSGKVSTHGFFGGRW